MSLSVNINDKTNFIWSIAGKLTGKTKVGYEIPFTRYFYKYEPPRPSAEIKKEILAIEKELEGALAEVFGG